MDQVRGKVILRVVLPAEVVNLVVTSATTTVVEVSRKVESEEAVVKASWTRNVVLVVDLVVVLALQLVVVEWLPSIS